MFAMEIPPLMIVAASASMGATTYGLIKLGEYFQKRGWFQEPKPPFYYLRKFGRWVVRQGRTA